MRLSDFQVLSFDCYGTLIDWETGIVGALAPLLALAPDPPQPEQALEAFALAETEQEQATPELAYPEVLGAVHRRLARQWRLDAPEGLHQRFAASLPDWPPFPDSAEALAYLGRHFRLVILSNVDRAGLAASAARLGVAFDAAYTAEDIGSYKPEARNFEYLLERVRADLGLGKGDILHTAQSLFHDHVPAKRIGLATAWIDRRHDRSGWGATVEPAEMPPFDFRFTSLAELAGAHESALAAGSAPQAGHTL